VKAESGILDLGCGSGRDARHVGSLGDYVVALDRCCELLAIVAEHTLSKLVAESSTS
jgi:predicted RNA methylase